MRYDQRRLGLRRIDDDAHEQPRNQQLVRIGEGGADGDGAGGRIDAIVDEIEAAGMRILIIIGEPEPRHRRCWRLPVLGRLLGAQDIIEIGPLADIEDDIDRVELDEGGQHVARRADEVADAVGGPPDTPGERRVDARIAEVEFRLLEFRLAGVDRRHRRLLVGQRLIEGFLTDVAVAEQAARPLVVLTAADDLRLRLDHPRRRDIDRRLIRGPLDREQQRPRRHILALAEFACDEEALNAGPQIDLIDGDDAADILDGRLELSPRNRSDDHRGRRRRRRLRLFLIAAGGESECEHKRRGEGSRPDVRWPDA